MKCYRYDLEEFGICKLSELDSSAAAIALEKFGICMYHGHLCMKSYCNLSIVLTACIECVIRWSHREEKRMFYGVLMHVKSDFCHVCSLGK